MLQIFGPDKTVTALFRDYEDLFKYISRREQSKAEDIWSFVVFPHKRLSCLYYKTLEKSFSKVGREAFENELDLLEISTGDFQNPRQIPVTPEVNVQDLKKTWCQEYCDSHNYLLVETPQDMPFYEGRQSPTLFPTIVQRAC